MYLNQWNKVANQQYQAQAVAWELPQSQIVKGQWVG